MKPLVPRLALALGLMLATPAFPVTPDEVLADPALESRARDISRALRCPVCQGESIDDSNAGISKTLRLVVRERLVAGDSDAEVIAFVTDRFGEFVLFDPPKTGANLILWLAGPTMLLAGVAIAVVALRRRPDAPAEADLSPEEQARLAELIKD